MGRGLRVAGGSIWPLASTGVFHISIRHILPENFIEIPQVVQKLWIIPLSILAIFINFHQVFGFFYISLLQRNKWCQFLTDDASIFSLSTYFKKIAEQLFKVILKLDKFFLKYNLTPSAPPPPPSSPQGKTTSKKCSLIRAEILKIVV